MYAQIYHSNHEYDNTAALAIVTKIDVNKMTEKLHTVFKEDSFISGGC